MTCSSNKLSVSTESSLMSSVYAKMYVIYEYTTIHCLMFKLFIYTNMQKKKKKKFFLWIFREISIIGMRNSFISSIRCPQDYHFVFESLGSLSSLLESLTKMNLPSDKKITMMLMFHPQLQTYYFRFFDNGQVSYR